MSKLPSLWSYKILLRIYASLCPLWKQFTTHLPARIHTKILWDAPYAPVTIRRIIRAAKLRNISSFVRNQIQITINLHNLKFKPNNVKYSHPSTNIPSNNHPTNFQTYAQTTELTSSKYSSTNSRYQYTNVELPKRILTPN